MNIRSITIGMGCVLVPCALAAQVVFPGAEWERRTPEQSGLDPEAVARIGAQMKQAQANGVLIHKGYLVAEWTDWGPATNRCNVQSITKSITSMLLGLALTEGLIPSLDAKVKDYYPDFDVGPHTAEITFRHLVSNTSGIALNVSHKVSRNFYIDPGNMPPGIESRYHNDHAFELAKALTYIYGQDLQQVLQERILDKIGARQNPVKWESRPQTSIRLANGKEVRVVAGYCYSEWTAQDLARVGWLYLNLGNWNGRQILSPAFVIESLKPIPQPVRAFQGSALRRGAPPEDPNRQLRDRCYGLSWWGFEIEGNLTWMMSGYGGQFCIVLPEYDLVMTKINKSPNPSGSVDTALVLQLAAESD